METQQCVKCNEIKALTEFSTNRTKNSNAYKVQSLYKTSCNVCLAEYAREWRKKNKGYNGSGKLKLYPEADPLLISALRVKITEAKSNNKRTNRPFDMDLDYLYELFLEQEGRCIYTGEEFNIERKHPANVSIDKIVPDLGYVKGNLQLVCWAVNRAKGDLEHDTFIDMCKAVVERVTTIPTGSTLK